MKKILCLGLLLLLLLPASGLAGGVIPNLREAPSDTPAPAVFSFRSGIRWNMSRELVRALEQSMELTERNQDGWSVLFPLAPVEVSKFTADLVYMFYNDRLKMISYDFGVGKTAEDYRYLTGALDSVYGEHTEPGPEAIIGVMDQIYPGYYQAGSLLNRRGWTAGEDTLIYLYYYTDSAFAILYVNAGGAPVTYQTNGL